MKTPIMPANQLVTERIAYSAAPERPPLHWPGGARVASTFIDGLKVETQSAADRLIEGAPLCSRRPVACAAQRALGCAGNLRHP